MIQSHLDQIRVFPSKVQAPRKKSEYRAHADTNCPSQQDEFGQQFLQQQNLEEVVSQGYELTISQENEQGFGKS